MVSIGIDIGTSNTVVATVDPNGKAFAHRIDSSALVPSAVFLDAQAGAPSFGTAAQTFMGDETSQGWGYRRWKLAIGDDVTIARHRFPDGDTVVTPEQLTTWLVEHVVHQVTGGVGGQEVEDVVVTVPHGWRRSSPHKVVATRNAAAAAKLGGRSLTVQERTVDEPVAAAAFWLHHTRDRALFVNRTVLVVDIGGGTFDLSLVRVGGPHRPLVVVDANNHEVAGDHVTALVMTDAFRAASPDAGVSHLTDAGALLDLVASGTEPWLMKAFLAAEAAMRGTSRAMATAEERGREPGNAAAAFLLQGPAGEHIQADLRVRHFIQVAEPFYVAGRNLLRRFLRPQDRADLPMAVVFAGGGSRIGGVRQHIVRPVLEELLGGDGAAAALSWMLNDGISDQAIALGAALIANRIESVEERLLFDVGMRLNAPPGMARPLGIEPDGRDRVELIVSPLLAKGTPLPAHFTTKDVGAPIWLPPNTQVAVTLVSFDDPQDPYTQPWASDEANGPESIEADLEVWATAEGVLGVTVRPRGRAEITFEGQLERVRERLVPQPPEIGGFGQPARTAVPLPPVRSPHEVARAHASLSNPKGN